MEVPEEQLEPPGDRSGVGCPAPCDKAGKAKYLSRHDAHKAKKRVKKRDNKKTYPYLCRYCGYWHLSHYRYTK